MNALHRPLPASGAAPGRISGRAPGSQHLRNDNRGRPGQAGAGRVPWFGPNAPRRTPPHAGSVAANSAMRRHGAGGWCLHAVRHMRTALTASLLAAVCGLTAAWAPGAEAQTVRGLVIGIDEYAALKDLRGAVNDARDVARALAGTGVEDLVVLEDDAATRARVVDAWQGLLRRAEPGDTLVLTYAGHGGQERERVPGSERDGRDEVLLLGGFRSKGPGTRERIFDDELNQWFVEAGARGLRVVFVADSCHSGTLTRSVDPRAPQPSLRTAAYTISDDMLSLDMPEAAATVDEADLAHVSFLAAGQEHEQVPEIALLDETGRPEPRGALSYMFARAVEGDADIDGDGVLRRDELWRFVRENVRMLAEARQTPNLLPNTRGGEAVLWLNPQSRPATAAAAAQDGAGAPTGDAAESLGAVRLTVLHVDSGTLAAVRDRLDDVRMVSIEESPDLVWDAQRRQVVTGLGDVTAHDVGLAELSAVIGKWKAVRTVRALSARASLRMRVYPHDGAHPEGARIEVEIDRLRQPRLTVIGFSGNGVVHYLYPLQSDPAEIPLGQPFRLELEVTPPFGADHIVAVSAQSPLTALNAELDGLDGLPAADRAAELLAAAAVEAEGWWSGIQGLFTVP